VACLPGETTQEEWKRQIQENPGPWGELATDNIILTVPTANLRTLENPEPLLRLWDEVMQAVARLGAEPFPLRLPQRIVADVQISVGECLGQTSVHAAPRGLALSGGAGGTEPACQCRRRKRRGFDPWVGKIPLEEEKAICSNILAWKISWTEEPGGLQSMGSQRVGHDGGDLAHAM